MDSNLKKKKKFLLISGLFIFSFLFAGSVEERSVQETVLDKRNIRCSRRTLHLSRAAASSLPSALCEGAKYACREWSNDCCGCWGVQEGLADPVLGNKTQDDFNKEYWQDCDDAHRTCVRKGGVCCICYFVQNSTIGFVKSLKTSYENAFPEGSNDYKMNAPCDGCATALWCPLSLIETCVFDSCPLLCEICYNSDNCCEDTAACAVDSIEGEALQTLEVIVGNLAYCFCGYEDFSWNRSTPKEIKRIETNNGILRAVRQGHCELNLNPVPGKNVFLPLYNKQLRDSKNKILRDQQVIEV